MVYMFQSDSTHGKFSGWSRLKHGSLSLIESSSPSSRSKILPKSNGMILVVNMLLSPLMSLPTWRRLGLTWKVEEKGSSLPLPLIPPCLEWAWTLRSMTTSSRLSEISSALPSAWPFWPRSSMTTLTWWKDSWPQSMPSLDGPWWSLWEAVPSIKYTVPSHRQTNKKQTKSLGITWGYGNRLGPGIIMKPFVQLCAIPFAQESGTNSV